MSQFQFRRAEEEDLAVLWPIFQDAIERRRKDGSTQWQDGYPNEEVLRSDIEKGNAYVLTEQDQAIGYTALIFNDEPAYNQIDGAWLSRGEFGVLHRIVIAEDQLGNGLSGRILEFAEDIARESGIASMRADTNFDNPGMIRVFEKAGYRYCGEVKMRGGTRKAFEKVL